MTPAERHEWYRRYSLNIGNQKMPANYPPPNNPNAYPAFSPRSPTLTIASKSQRPPTGPQGKVLNYGQHQLGPSRRSPREMYTKQLLMALAPPPVRMGKNPKQMSAFTLGNEGRRGYGRMGMMAPMSPHATRLSELSRRAIQMYDGQVRHFRLI